MLCKQPFVRDPTGRVFKLALLTGNLELAVQGIPFPCGQCLPCRINRRRLWTHRLLLEQIDHQFSSFITLTYDDNFLPSDLSISKRTLQLFLKRIRKIYPFHLRYYAVGEYGSKSKRPHYHLILFGFDPVFHNLVQKCWPFGFSYTAECNYHTIQYVCGYITKKFIKKSDFVFPEFALMSKKPGLGYNQISKLADLIKDNNNLFLDKLPEYIRHGHKKLPFDRFTKSKLIKILSLNYDCSDFIRANLFKFFYAKNDSRFSLDFSPLSSLLISESEQRNRQIESRNKIFNQRNVL